jgi:hypothetical protein
VRQRVALATTLLLSASLVTAALAAYDARPPIAHTGGFGEPTCRECHFDGPSSPSGTVALGGLPEQYRFGAVYRLVVTIGDSTARVGGFQLAARVAAGPHAGTQAGLLCAMDVRVAVVTDTASGVQYASHAGAAPADSLRWELEWHAPSEDVGSVIFHIAANSANDDDSMLGDVILLGKWEARRAGGQEPRVRDQGVSGCR